ncbi:MAG: hypothetical protein PHX77_00020 [Candidatus Bipolaricaulis sp.]|nr:hypothetical protein [Candidatus Bipolaricaulis sp.]
MTRVLALFSGSLASRVAAKLVERHPAVDAVSLIHFRSPFSADSDDLRELVKGEWTAVPFRTQSLKREYRRFIEPGCGFSLDGACVSCRSLQLSRAARYMQRIKADFLVTGDRIGVHGVEREDLMALTERVGLEGRVLRPLCQSASRKPRTLEEWASLERTRTVELEDRAVADLGRGLDLDPRDPLASRYRCKLTIPGFGERAANLFQEEGFTLNGLRLLDFALYYKIEPDTKVVIALTEAEKHELQTLFLPQDLRVYHSTPHGPMALVRTDWTTKTDSERRRVIELAARITATHVDSARATPVAVYFRLESDEETLLFNAHPFSSCDEILGLAGVETMALPERQAVRA